MLTTDLSPHRVDPRTKRTRQLLVQAFLDLLNEKSFEAITIQEITERATVNRATFYAHFEDKYMLSDYVFAESFRQAVGTKVPADAQFSRPNVQALIQAVCEYLGYLQGHCAPSSRSHFDASVERIINQELYSVLLAWLQEAKRGKDNRGDLDLRATVASWAIYGAAWRWSRDEQKEPPQDFARKTLPMIMAGLEAH